MELTKTALPSEMGGGVAQPCTFSSFFLSHPRFKMISKLSVKIKMEMGGGVAQPCTNMFLFHPRSNNNIKVEMGGGVAKSFNDIMF